MPLIVAAHRWALGVGDDAAEAAASWEAGELRQSAGRWVWLVPEAVHTLRGLAHGERPDWRQWTGLKAEAFFARRDPGPFVRVLAAPFEDRLRGVKVFVRRALRGPAFALNAVVLLPAGARARRAGARPALGLPQGARALVLAPHPDDETIMCGATLAASRRRGDAVRIVAVTSGEATRQVGDLGDVVAGREAEERAAAQALGVDDIAFWRRPDGHLGDGREELKARIADEVRAFAPSDVYAPFPFDSHGDHVAAAFALADALGSLGEDAAGIAVHAGFIQTVPSPEWVTRLVPARGNWRAKRAAIAAHGSRNAAIFAKPLQAARLHREHALRPAEAFADLTAAGYISLVAAVEAEGVAAPAVWPLHHALFLTADLRRTAAQRARLTALLRDAARR